MSRPFRFGAELGYASSGPEWRDLVHAVEDSGYATLLLADHLDDRLAALPALAAAAGASTTLRIGSLVIGVDFRNPVVLAKEAATLDLLSEGRLELGLGAGWSAADYDAAGVAMAAPSVRIERLREVTTMIRTLLSGDELNFNGSHFAAREAVVRPRPVQKDLPILIGGGGTKALTVAAQLADIVSINFRLHSGMIDAAAMSTGSGGATHDKVAVVKRAAGQRFSQLELSNSVYAVDLDPDTDASTSRIANQFQITPDQVRDSPHFLVGSIDKVVDDLVRRREEYGISYVIFASDTYRLATPVVTALAGR